MNQKRYITYILIVIFLLLIISLPKKTIDKTKSFAIASIGPIYDCFCSISKFILKVGPVIHEENNNKLFLEKERLALENVFLKNQLNGINEWLLFENRIDDQTEKFKNLNQQNEKDLHLASFFKRRAEEIKDILNMQYQAILAKVIFRDPSSWSSSIWINVGEKTNNNLKKQIIAKNSVVVLGRNLLGVVEYVGYRLSRVRLITDAGLIPSVRAVRGSSQDSTLLNIIQSLKEHIYLRDNVFLSKDQKENFFDILSQLGNKLTKDREEKYLAKGELHGCSNPFWRSRGVTLKGIGFNYDYPDEEGPARDLRKGSIISDANLNLKEEALLEVGDLLRTTGMDGVFPKGLNVAIVSKVHDLKDGDYAYEIEAKPTVVNLNELEFVFVLPPLESEKNDNL